MGVEQPLRGKEIRVTAETTLGPKDPESANTFEQLLADAAHSSHVRLPESGGTIAPGTRLADGRFIVQRQLGQGGMGVVYEAKDTSHHSLVALKTLTYAEPASIYRIKNEFRGLADVAHPNLVGLHELFVDNGRWFFTMDLVRGVSLLEYVRQEPDNLLRVKDVFRQLIEGVRAIHAEGKLHRDLKPSNVLVRRDGRVVILDFGLLSDKDEGGVGRTIGAMACGTPAYMAPEQTSGTATEASDWYAVGVMLYEVLVGKLPFEGSVGEVLYAKRHTSARPASEERAGIPPDLDELCTSLLNTNPESRPSAEAVQEIFGKGEARPSRIETFEAKLPFVGRTSELRTLEASLEVVAQGTPAAVFVSGLSGIGKSALVERFCRNLPEDEDAVVLVGRCYERESVPFKAFDGLVDSLSRHLLQLGREEAAALMPRGVHAACRLFPVLSRVPAVAAAPARKSLPTDPQELRRLGFGALKELLGRIAERALLVICVDDLQWGDIDSALLLAELFAPPEPPGVLFIGSYRSDELSSSAFLSTLFGEARFKENVHTHVIELRPLSSEDTAQLVSELTADRAMLTPERHTFGEAEGYPLFIHELCRAQAGAASMQGLSLQDVISARLEKLAANERALLNVVALSGRPVNVAVAARAAEVSLEESALVERLRNERLLRTRSQDGVRTLECYHDRIRSVAASLLARTDVVARHLALARALEEEAEKDYEALAYHYENADRIDLAAPFAEQAGDAAAKVLAFDRAARWYRLTLTSEGLPAEERCSILLRLANALSHSGRGVQAGESYLAAAALSDSSAAITLRCRAAEQFTVTGHTERGEEILAGVLRDVNLPVMTSTSAMWRTLLKERALLWMRGLRFKQTPRSEIKPKELLRLEACKVATDLYSLSDIGWGAAFSSRHLRLALNSGDVEHVFIGLCAELVSLGSEGPHRAKRVKDLQDVAEGLLPNITDNAVRGALQMSLGIVETMFGNFRAARDRCQTAENIFRTECVDVTWELNSTRGFWLIGLVATGEMRRASQLLEGWLKDAYTRSDLYAQCYLQLNAPVPLLAADDPEGAEQAVTRALDGWTHRGFDQVLLNACDARTHIALYRGPSTEELEELHAAYQRFFLSLLAHIQANRIFSHYFSSCCLLGLAELGKDATRNLKGVAKHAAKLREAKVTFALGYAELLDGALASRAGRKDDSLAHLSASEDAFKLANMDLYAACARRRRGQIMGAEGAEILGSADRTMRQLGVVEPGRFMAALTPGYVIG